MPTRCTLVALLTGARVQDFMQLPLVEEIQPISRQRGASRHHPQRALVDSTYDSKPHPQALPRGVETWLA